MRESPLKGIRVLDFGSFMAGPTAAMLLAFLGAEVIKVESRKRFDPSRVYVHAPGRPLADPRYGEQVFGSANLNKRSLTVDLTTPKGKEIIRQLVAKCDVLIENMSPGTMKKLGLDYETLHAIKPDLIYLSSSACGQTGPDCHEIGYAANFATKVGLCALTGYRDGEPSLFTASMDLRSASLAALAMLSMLYHRQMTGEGQYADLASQEAMAEQLGDVYMDFWCNGNEQVRDGNHRRGYCPCNVYECSTPDTWVSIAVADQTEWAALCAVIGRPELRADPRFDTYEHRKEHEEELDTLLTQWSKGYEKHQAAALLQTVGVAAGPLLDARDMVSDPQIQAMKAFQWIDHPILGKDLAVSPPWKFSETPVVPLRHACGLGEDTESILRELLGYSVEEVDHLAAEEVI